MSFTNTLSPYIALIMISTSGHADIFTGGSVDQIYLYPTKSTIFYDPGVTPIIQPGPTFTNFYFDNGPQGSGYATFTFNNNQIDIVLDNTNHAGAATFNGIDWNFSNIANITGATLDAATSAAFSSSVVTFDAKDVFINWQGASWANGDKVVINVNPSVSNVPLPSVAWLFLSGIVGLLGLKRSK